MLREISEAPGTRIYFAHLRTVEMGTEAIGKILGPGLVAVSEGGARALRELGLPAALPSHSSEHEQGSVRVATRLHLTLHGMRND